MRPSLAKLFAQVMADAPALQAAKTADWSRLFAVPACIVGKRKNAAPLVLPGNELGIEAVPTLYDFALGCCVQLVSHDEIAEHDAQGRLTGFATEVLARLDERIRFHAADTNRTPYAYAKLTRIRFEESVMEDVPGREEKEKEIAAFGAVAEEFFETSWVSALAADDRATILKWKEDKGKDHAELQDYCRRFAAKWPNTPGGDNCRSIVQSLEAPSLDLYVERTWAHPLPSISLEYQNLTGITFRLVRITVDDFAKHDQFSGTLFRIGKTFREYVRRPAAKTWTVNLKPADKLHKFQQTLPVPSDIPKGHYLLFATGNCPGEKTPPIYARMITVTDLAFVTTRIPGGFSGYVLDAEKGTPIADAEVEFWRPVKNEWVRKTTVKTGADGSFFIPEPKERGYLRAVKGTDEVVSPLNAQRRTSRPCPRNGRNIRPEGAGSGGARTCTDALELV